MFKKLLAKLIGHEISDITFEGQSSPVNHEQERQLAEERKKQNQETFGFKSETTVEDEEVSMPTETEERD